MLCTAFTPCLASSRTRWALGTLAGLMAIAVASPSWAAPRKSGAVQIKRAKSSAHRAAHASAGALTGSGSGLSLDQEIDQFERSAKFWETSGPAVEGSDAQLAMVFALACKEQALNLKARKARSEGRPSEASRFAREAREARSKWAVAHAPTQQSGGMGSGGGSGMMGPEGMGGPGMPGGMMGGPGMPGSEAMGSPGMSGPPPGMVGSPGMSGPPGMSGSMGPR